MRTVEKLLTAVVLCAACCGVAHALPAFPGAEGFGAETAGGRGGRVITVTNLNDAGPGSLRAALAESGRRTIVFAVAGTIMLNSSLVIANDHVTIAGQSAPGAGVTLRGYSLLIKAEDVVVRYIRVRLGDQGFRTEDAISIMSGARRVILDHVSASWSVDEVLSPSGDIRDITVQWCVISESLNASHHKKGEHGYGSLLRATGGVSLHHNLWAHHRGRNPRFGDNYGNFFQPSPTFDFRNNVIYDWGDYASGLVDGDIAVNYVANYLKPGPSLRNVTPITLTPHAGRKTRFYVADNVVAGHPELAPEQGNFFVVEGSTAKPELTLVPQPFAAPAVHTDTAQQAYERVLNEAGAVLPERDAVDQRVIDQVRQGSGRLIDSQQDVGGWPQMAGGTAALDSDGDGMPDAWELAHGLDPQKAADGAQPAADGSGYTNLEVYLNALAARRDRAVGAP